MLWIQTPKGGSESVSPFHSTFNSYKAATDQYPFFATLVHIKCCLYKQKIYKTCQVSRLGYLQDCPFPDTSTHLTRSSRGGIVQLSLNHCNVLERWRPAFSMAA